MNRLCSSLAGLCVLIFAFAACKPKEVNQLSDAASALRTVFAAETAKLAGATKQIVMIVPKVVPGATANLGDEFKSAFQKEGLSVVEIKAVDLGNPMRYAEYGLKVADLIEAIEKHPQAGAIVSLVGLPKINHPGQVPAIHPPILVVATAQIGMSPGVPANPSVLMQMLDAKIIQVAIVDGSGTPTGKGDKASQLFNQHYQILRASQ